MDIAKLFDRVATLELQINKPGKLISVHNEKSGCKEWRKLPNKLRAFETFSFTAAKRPGSARISNVRFCPFCSTEVEPS